MIPANPFCTRFVRPGAIEYRFTVDQPDQLNLITEKVNSSVRGLIIGPHGSGKSTLIHSLLPILKRRYRNVVGFQLCDPRPARRINRWRIAGKSWPTIKAQFDQLDRRDLLIIDGIEQLPTVNRLRLFRGASRSGPSILATSHRRLLAYSVVFETTLDRRRIMELTEQLIKSSAPSVAGLVRNRLANQDWERTTNLRALWFECYDDVQTFQRQTLTK